MAQQERGEGLAVRLDATPLGSSGDPESTRVRRGTRQAWAVGAVGLAIVGLHGAALLGFVHSRSRARARDIDSVLDATLAGLAALALAWVYLITPALADLSVPVPIRVLLACYPPLSVFLVVIVARIAFSPGM